MDDTVSGWSILYSSSSYFPILMNPIVILLRNCVEVCTFYVCYLSNLIFADKLVSVKINLRNDTSKNSLSYAVKV